MPKIGPESASQDYGFITDYLCEIVHELRRLDVLGRVKNRFELFDASGSSQGLASRDVRAVHKTLSGLLKLMYSQGQVTDSQLEELLLLALEGRQRIRGQLHLMAPGEYYPVKLGRIKLDPARLRRRVDSKLDLLMGKVPRGLKS